MRERIALLAASAEAVWTRQAHEFEWLVKAAYTAGATREDLQTAVNSGRLLGNPPEAVVTEAFATVHAYQWMADCPSGHSNDSALFGERRRTERMEAWVPCTIK
jgi:hypothetical protein